MTWSKITAGGSATTWSGLTAGGSSTTWSGSTAGGSATTWSSSTAGGSATTWPGQYSLFSVQSFIWVPFGQLTDLWDGRDFAPKASTMAPYKAQAIRAIAVWNPSSITASTFTAERQP